jgi:hypothetical protein
MVTPYDRIVTMFGERWAHLHAESNPSPLRDDHNDLLTMAVEPEFLSRNRAPSAEPYLGSYRPSQVPSHPVSAVRSLPSLVRF